MTGTKKKFRFSLFTPKEKTIEVPPKEEKRSLEINVEEQLAQYEQTEIQAGDATLQDGKIVTSTGRVLDLTEEEIKDIAAYEYSRNARRDATIEKLQKLVENQNEQSR